MPKKGIDISSLIGKQFNRLTILEDLGKIGNEKKVKCICQCGNIKVANIYNVLRYITQSCGCLFTEVSMKVKTKHGIGNHPLTRCWRHMIRRCYNKNDAGYINYGAKGVRVCKEWRNEVLPFYKWAIANGYKKGLQLDKDKLYPAKTGLLYSPEYCCFLSREENSWHKKKSLIVEYNSEKKCLAEWCKILSLDWQLVRNRIIVSKWDVKKSFETKVRYMKTNKKIAI